MTSIEPLKIANVDLAVTRQLEHCPPKMMVRELTMNAMEASSKDQTGSGLIIFGAITDETCGDARKLFIWNNGPGMTAHELRIATDLSSSINKKAGLYENFGIGAKVAALLSNKLGFRMWSCRNGRVSEVILIKDEETGRYGKYVFEHDDGTTTTVRDITNKMPECQKIFARENDTPKSWNIFDPSRDWTAVTLFGNFPSQDTVVSPYGDAEKQTGWLPAALYRRFWNIPSNVEIYLTSSVFTRDASRYFKPISNRLDAFTKHEVVTVEGGIRIHYFHDAKVKGKGGAEYLQSYNGALCAVTTFGALIHKGEMYDYMGENDWVFNAKYFGIPFGYKNLSIAIELPKDFEVFGSKVMPNSYRTAIMYGHNKEDVKCKHFSHLVIENRPKWFIDVIEESSPSNTASTEIKKQLQELLDELLLRESSPSRDKSGDVNTVRGNKGRGGGDGPDNPDPNPDPKPSNKTGLNFNSAGAIRASISLNDVRAPQTIFVYEDETIEEKQMKNKAASFDEENNILMINGKYNALSAIKNDLADRHANHPDQDMVLTTAEKKARDILALLTGRVVVYAKAKKKKGLSWAEAEIEKALSPESMTMAADAWASVMTPYHSEMSRAFKIEKIS